MSELLNDPLNLGILEHLVSGNGVEINISALSKSFKRHRNTIKTQVDALLENEIIHTPVYPFTWLYTEYPLLVIARAELPRTKAMDEWLKDDEHIFGAFYTRDEEYNTLLIEYHKDLYEYGEWRKQLIKDGKLPPRDNRYPAEAQFFSNKHIVKAKPHYPLYKMECMFKKKRDVVINGYEINRLCFQILKKLMRGEGIRTNENYLAQELGVHRRTVEKRIEALLEAGIVGNPVCRFPRFFVPPNQYLVYTLLEITCDSREKVVAHFKTDPNISMVIESVSGRYSYLLFGAFNNVGEHIEWEEELDVKLTNCLGAMKTMYLSPTKTTSIDQQKVSLGIIRRRMAELKL